MEMMPYQPTAALHAASPRSETATAESLLPHWGPPSADWRAGLPALGGEEFTLRELELSDAPTLFAELTTEEVARFISPPPTSVEGFERFIRWAHTRRAQGRYVCFGIVPAGHTRAVGLFQLHLDAADTDTAEWGFVLGRAYWGTGLFVAGARRVVDFAFAHLGLARLVAHAAVPNGRGNGALRKLGAVCEAVLSQSFERHGERLDQALWTLRPDLWWAHAGLRAVVH